MRIRKLWRPDGGVRVNIGSGHDYRAGWINVDRYAKRADLRFDLLKFPWDLEDDSVDWLYANQIVEHVPPRLGDEDGLIRVLREVHRILKAGGRMYIGVPMAGTVSDYANITHYRHFVKSSFDFLPGGPAKTSNLAPQAALRFRLLARKTHRKIRIAGLDTSYHFPKYLRFDPNIGVRYGLVFILEKIPGPD